MAQNKYQGLPEDFLHLYNILNSSVIFYANNFSLFLNYLICCILTYKCFYVFIQKKIKIICSNKLPQAWQLKNNTDLLTYSSLGQKSGTHLTGLNQKIGRMCSFLDYPGNSQSLCFFQHLEAIHVPLPLNPFCQPTLHLYFFCCHVSLYYLVCLILPVLRAELCDYIGHTRIFQDNLPISVSHL